MKTLLKSMLIIAGIAIIGSGQIFAQNKNEVKEIKIKTTAVCGMCEERIENDMKFEKGVKSVDLDLDTKIVTIKYKANKTTPEKLRKAISKIGYDADDVPADPKAYKKLPACCKKDVAPH